MATKMLESSAVSAFCESVAVMHSAGIQMDEAVFLLGENMEDAAFKRACDDVYKELIVGKPLALAMDDSGCFPSHVVDMVGAGEHAGRLENVLWSLARYYDEEDRLYAKIKIEIAPDATFSQRHHDARSQTTPHQAFVQKLRVALEMDAALGNLALLGAQAFQFSF
mgnify:CR=1 FL=1